MRKKLALGVFTILAVLLPAAAASATSESVTGSLTKDQQTFYTNGRTVTVGGTSIKFQKTDGPEIDLKWYKCSDTSVAGSWVNFENPDPTAQKTLGTGFLSSTVFCLAAWDHGTNGTDTFTGTLQYNV